MYIDKFMQVESGNHLSAYTTQSEHKKCIFATFKNLNLKIKGSATLFKLNIKSNLTHLLTFDICLRGR